MNSTTGWVVTVSFLLFVQQNMTRALSSQVDPTIVVVAVTLLECLLCTPRSTAYLAVSSLFGNVAFFLGISLVK